MFALDYNEELMHRLMMIISETVEEINVVQENTMENKIRGILGLYDITQSNIKNVASDFEEKINMYLSVKKLDGLSLKFLHNYHFMLVKFAKYLNKSVSEVNITDLRTYLAYKCSSLETTSINNNISVIKNFFKWLVDEEYLEKDPTRKRIDPLSLDTFSQNLRIS